MKLKLSLLLMAIICTFNIFAKDICIITGNVNDENGYALAYATIKLKNIENDNVLGTTTDENGYFCFNNIKTSKYQITISFIGFTEYKSEIFNLNNKNYEFKNIILNKENNKLTEVVVTSKSKLSEIKPSHIKYKTEGLVSQAGGNAGDILKMMPSISMGGSPGHNRDIRFRGLGKSYTKVLVNGRETGLRGNDRESIIDQIPASSIESIEILSVPGVEYQSEGINGIVNIILKENKSYGTKGEMEILAGNYDGLSGGINLSHKTKKLNLYGQYDFQQRSLDKTKDKFKTSIKNGETTGFENSIEKEDKYFNNQLIRTGFDYYINSKSKFNAEYVYGYQLEEKNKTNTITKLNGDNTYKSSSREIKSESKPNKYHQAITSFSHVFDKNQKMIANFGYSTSEISKFEEKKVYKLTEDGQWANFEPKLENKNELKKDKQYNWGLVFSNFTLGKQNFKFGYTGKSESSNFDVSTDKYNYKKLSWSNSSKVNDNFDINEITHSLYLSDDFTYSFLKVKAGLRYENTKIKSTLGEDVSTQKSNYGVLLPNVSLTANIDESQYITFNFGRRIRRPGFKDMNPYVEEKEAGFFKKGNPDLKPEKAWAYELGYLKNFDKFNFGTNIFYRDINNVIQKTRTESEDGIITEQPNNTGGARLIGVEFMAAVNPVDFWQINASYSLFDSKITSGDYKGDALKDQYKWTAKAINDFKLPFNTNLQLSFNAVGPKKSDTKVEDALWFADLGIRKELVKGGSLTLRVTDIFDSLKKHKTEYTSKSSSVENETTLGRVFLIGMKYKF